jgi:hypothetical protein
VTFCSIFYGQTPLVTKPEVGKLLTILDCSKWLPIIEHKEAIETLTYFGTCKALKPHDQTNKFHVWMKSLKTNPVTSFQTRGVRVPLNGYWLGHDCCPAMARTVSAFTHWPLFGDGRASPCTFFWTLKKTIASIPSALNTIWTLGPFFFPYLVPLCLQHHCDLGLFVFLFLFPCWVFFLYLFIYFT